MQQNLFQAKGAASVKVQKQRVDRIDWWSLGTRGSLGKKGGADAARKTGSTRTAGLVHARLTCC